MKSFGYLKLYTVVHPHGRGMGRSVRAMADAVPVLPGPSAALSRANLASGGVRAVLSWMGAGRATGVTLPLTVEIRLHTVRTR